MKSINMKILYCRVAWMNYYNFEICPMDIIKNGGSYPSNEKNEIYNFQKIGNWFYGFVQSPKTIDIQKLGALRDDDVAEHVLVIWVATNPNKNRQVIVGWYENANVYKEYKELNDEAKEHRIMQLNNIYNISSQKALLLPVERREYIIDKSILGQNQFAYGNDCDNVKVIDYINGILQKYNNKKIKLVS